MLYVKICNSGGFFIKRKSKMLIAFMLLILAFTISISFASEDVESVQANEDIGQEPIGISDESADDLKESDSTDENMLNSVDDTEKLSVDGEYGNFTELQNLIESKGSGSTIYLNKSYVYDEGFVKTGVFIDKELTIDGQGHSIDGNFSARILNVTSSKITLKNIIFRNTKLDYANGGAIYFSNNMSGCEFDNVSFFNNNLNIPDGNNHVVLGGAVYFAGSLSDSRFDNCRFENNSLTGRSTLNKFKGVAIAVEGVAANLEFNNCNFEKET